MAKILAQQRAKDYDDRDFAWDETSLRIWKSVGLYGGLVLVQGLFLWVLLSGFVPGGVWTLAPVAIALMLCGFLPVLFGYTELGLTLFGAGLTGIAMEVAAVFGTSGTTLVLLVVVLIGGAIGLLAGATQSVKLGRAQAADV